MSGKVGVGESELELEQGGNYFKDVKNCYSKLFLSFRFTPLQWAAHGGHEGCVEFLLEDLQKFPEEEEGLGSGSFSPVHCAVKNNSNQCLQLLLSKFGQPEYANWPDKIKRTPLHIAGESNIGFLPKEV